MDIWLPYPISPPTRQLYSRSRFIIHSIRVIIHLNVPPKTSSYRPIPVTLFHRRCIKPNWDHLFDIISPYHSLRCSYTSQRIYLLNETAIYFVIISYSEVHVRVAIWKTYEIWTLTSGHEIIFIRPSYPIVVAVCIQRSRGHALSILWLVDRSVFPRSYTGCKK